MLSSPSCIALPTTRIPLQSHINIEPDSLTIGIIVASAVEDETTILAQVNAVTKTESPNEDPNTATSHGTPESTTESSKVPQTNPQVPSSSKRNIPPEPVLSVDHPIDFLHTAEHPGVEDIIDGKSYRRRSDLFLNREYTWLNFNARVLKEASDKRNPLLERLRFAGIVSANLDEFFMKRVGGLKQQVAAAVHNLSVDGRTPSQQINESYELIRIMEKNNAKVVSELLTLLTKKEIKVTKYTDLRKKEKSALREYYLHNIFPLVTPQAVDPAHPFPFVSNLSLNLLIKFSYKNDDIPLIGRVKVPVGNGIPRFVPIESSKESTNTFVPLEEIIANNLDVLFPDVKVVSCDFFRVTRNAITENAVEQADDLLITIEQELRERRLAPVVRLQVQSTMSQDNRNKLATELGLTDTIADVFETDFLLGTRDLLQIANLDVPEHRYLPNPSVTPPALSEDRSIFAMIQEAGSVLVHHPYESFSSSVEKFVQEASTDPSVRAIKMTLYRTSEDSLIIPSLIHASRNGKQVTVVLELKARFDEEANIRWAERLERSGIHVTYGVVGLKTHCKVILVLRQDQSGLARYAHIGTGNYHRGTAKQYSDIGLLTSDPDIGADLTELFNYLTTGYKPGRKYKKLLVAPKTLKLSLLQKITREIEHHKNGYMARIQMKMNGLEDPDIVKALYAASSAGVPIDLIVRDTCRLRPGIPGLSETIGVRSIIGRYLEHSRVYYFYNGGFEEYYIGSADAMQRNLSSRVETLAPVEKESLREELRTFLDLQLSDSRSAWTMNTDGSYQRPAPHPKNRKIKGSQEKIRQFLSRRSKLATKKRSHKTKTLAKSSHTNPTTLE